jgi:LuxR family transcriptional regulator, maltose regulon positive regulatory protein
MATQVAEQVATRARRPAVSASIPILTAKITAPDVPDWALRRPRITKLIAEGTRWCPLTLITAPAGSGKTMALALWAAAEPGMVAWVTVDEFDNRPGVFWAHVVAALRRSGAAVPEALPSARGRAADHVLLLWLAAALAAQDPPVTLVLDDLHLLADATVLDGVDYVLRNTGSGLRLLVAARMDPLLPLHRHRLAGELAEIRASDLAFTVTEAGELLARHGCTLAADSLDCLTRRTEGWAAGLRLAAISMSTHPDPDQIVKELITDDSFLTSYLVEEVLNPQPPAARDVLLSTSILERISGQAASELTGNDQAGTILPALARANAFVQPAGSGCYRYHTLFAEVLRLKLRHEHPGRVASLHRRAASWYERNGQLTFAVRHAAEAGDWQLAASTVIDGLAISEIIQPRGSPGLAGEFGGMPHGQAWAGPQPHLVCAAVALSAGRPESSVAALNAAEGILAGLPADQEITSRLAAAMIRLTFSLRSGDLTAAAAAVARAEALASKVPSGKLARHPDIRARVLSGRGAVELWSGHLTEAADVLESGMAAAGASGGENEPADCLGPLALAEALRGRLRRAAAVADRATAALTAAGQRRPPVLHPSPAALVALAWVHLEHYELREAHSRLRQADVALGLTPDKLIGAAAWLAVAYAALARGRAAAAAQSVARARSGWAVPAWLDHRLSLVQSRAYATAGDIQAALAAAERAGSGTSLEAAVTLAHAWATAGDTMNARRVLAPVRAALNGEPDRVHLQARVLDARLSYTSGDRPRGRRSLAAALDLAEPEQLRLPFVLERGWIGPVLRRDPELAHAHRNLLVPTLRHDQLPPHGVPEQAASRPAEPLSVREREVLRHISGLLSATEVASEMHITVNTVKTHLSNIYRKLAATRRGEAVRRARQLELI